MALGDEARRKEKLKRDIDELKSNFSTYKQEIEKNELRSHYIPTRRKWAHLVGEPISEALFNKWIMQGYNWGYMLGSPLNHHLTTTVKLAKLH